MNGEMAICMTCYYQDRIEENGVRSTCCLDCPDVDDNWCNSYRILPGDQLGPRLAELYNLLDVLTDALVGLTNIVEEVVDRDGLRPYSRLVHAGGPGPAN